MTRTKTPKKVSPIHKLQPGDILEVIVKLRKLSENYLSDAFTLYASFEEFGSPELEKEADKARHTLELAATRIANLLELLESTDYYKTILTRHEVARRKEDHMFVTGDASE